MIRITSLLIAIVALFFMAQAFGGVPIPGTNVAAPVVPFTTDDTYPSHLAIYGRGGFTHVRYSTQIRQIPAGRQEHGMLAYAHDSKAVYQLYSAPGGTWYRYATSTGSGSVGPPGPRGYDGYDGTNGAPGSQIYAAFGAPSSSHGVNGDFHLDRETGDYYLKAVGSWILTGNLTGPQGPPGPPAVVTQSAVLGALAEPSTGPIDRHPVNGTDVLIVTRDTSQNARWGVIGDGSVVLQDSAGLIWAKFHPANLAVELYDTAGVRRIGMTRTGNGTYYDAAGLQWAVLSGSGQSLEMFRATGTRSAGISRSGGITQYRTNGTTVAFSAISGAVTIQ